MNNRLAWSMSSKTKQCMKKIYREYRLIIKAMLDRNDKWENLTILFCSVSQWQPWNVTDSDDL